MVGAAILAGRGALRSGAGSVRICVDDDNVTAAHIAVPVALVTRWSDVLNNVQKYLHDWPEAIAIGPGFGEDAVARQLLDGTLSTWPGPLVIDADALNLLAGRLDDLAAALRSVVDTVRPFRTVITPHPAEMKRLLANGISTGEVDEQRFELARGVAARVGAVVLLKGVPTVIAHPQGAVRVSPAGTPALATGGSGDVLTGIIAALLAQGVESFDAAAVGAWAHGHAAELATGDRDARGITLDDVVERLRDVWVESPAALPPGVLAEVPRVW
jgi:NAD(P)H-hydrate epimerase